MKTKHLISFVAVGMVLITLLIKCSEIPLGFIPDEIIYLQDPFNVQQGVVTSTAAPNVNGASYPLSFRLLESKAPDGKKTTVLTDSVKTIVWKSSFNYDTDKTIESIYAKLDTVNAPVMQISEASGQIMFTASSAEVPEGQYKVTVEMSNSAGTRVYEDVFTANIIAGNPYWTLEPSSTSWNSEIGVWNSSPADAAQYEVSHNPSGPNKIHVIVCDKNGSIFSWKDGEIIPRGDRQKIEDFAFNESVYTKERATFIYPMVPFPFSPGGPTQYNNYYRIPAKHVAYDESFRGGFLNIIVGLRVFQKGEWTFKMTFPTITRIP